MALFTDGPVASLEDLAGQDSQLLDTASVEGIDVTRKLSLAQEAMSLELESRRVRLGHVVATAALRLWHTYRTLEMVYADAYFSQLNERYAGKRDQFVKLGQWAYEKLVQTGLGMTHSPVPRALMPEVVAVPGQLAAGMYYLAMSWVNARGQEGAGSTAAAIEIADNTVEVRPGKPPESAAGWNVFAGTEPNGLVQQNVAPIPVGTAWVQGWPLLAGGRTPGDGQTPDFYHPLRRVLQRG